MGSVEWLTWAWWLLIRAIIDLSKFALNGSFVSFLHLLGIEFLFLFSMTIGDFIL